MESVDDLLLNETMDDNQSFLNMELEALKSIYINEINVEEDSKYTVVSIELYPATADKLDEQYVRMTLQFHLSDDYPDDIPMIVIRNPRGLSDEKLDSIMKELHVIAEAKKGNSMLFEMIEAAKEYLTTGNRPCGECAICLYGFSDSDVFTKTECYHYFHSHCLARYAKNFQENAEDIEPDPKSKCDNNELLCPVCRVPIQFSGCEEEFPPPEASGDSFVLTDEILELQKKMAQLYQKQVKKGGIIDIEAERNKYLIEISNVPTKLSNGEKQEEIATKSNNEDSAIDVPTVKPESSEQVDTPVKEKRSFRGTNQHQDFRSRNNYRYQSEIQGNYSRNDGRYNRHSFRESRGHYYRGRGGKYSENFEQGYRRHAHSNVSERDCSESREDGDVLPSAKMDSNSYADSSSFCDDGSRASEGQRLENKHRYKSSPRHNRGYMRRGSSGVRSDKSNYLRRQNSNEFDKCNEAGDREEDTAVSQEHDRKERSYDGNRKSNYRYNRPNFENDRERYPDRNAPRGSRRGYGKHGNYFDSKYSLRDYPKKYEQKQPYSSRGFNSQERALYRESRHRNDFSSGSKPQSSRNSYSRQQGESDNSVKADNHETNKSQNNNLNQDCIKNKVQDSACSSDGYQKASASESTVYSANDLPGFSQQSSSKSFEKFQAENGLDISTAIKEKPQGSLRTAVNPPPGFANSMKKVIIGLQGANPPPGFNRS